MKWTLRLNKGFVDVTIGTDTTRYNAPSAGEGVFDLDDGDGEMTVTPSPDFYGLIAVQSAMDVNQDGRVDYLDFLAAQ